MADIFIEGFDKYGPYAAGGGDRLLTALTEGEWTVQSTLAGSNNFTIRPSLNSATGYSLQITGATLAKTMPSSLGRIIGGVRFNTNLVSYVGFRFYDSTNVQCQITINQMTGLISLWSGDLPNPVNVGAAIATSVVSVTAGTTHYIEWDISIGTSASYQIWLDDVSILSGTGNTRGGSTNNTFNSFMVQANAVGGLITVDDLYLFDSTGGVNNAVLNTAPRVETQFPVSDSAVQFAFGGASLGQAYYSTTGNLFNSTAQLVLVRATALVTGTVQSIGFLPTVSAGGARTRAAMYADSSGVPGALLSGGPEALGVLSGVVTTLSLTTPQSITSGTVYWIGFVTDSVWPSINSGFNIIALVDGTAAGYLQGVTYGAPPNPAGTMLPGFGSFMIYGNVTGVTGNFSEVDTNPPYGNASYVFDNTAGHEDLYNFPALVSTPAAIYTVCVKGYLRKADAGPRTIDMRMKSAAVESSGNNTGLLPDTSFRWLDSFFDVDPNTSVAWTASGLNAAKSGVKIVT